MELFRQHPTAGRFQPCRMPGVSRAFAQQDRSPPLVLAGNASESHPMSDPGGKWTPERSPHPQQVFPMLPSTPSRTHRRQTGTPRKVNAARRTSPRIEKALNCCAFPNPITSPLNGGLSPSACRAPAEYEGSSCVRQCYRIVTACQQGHKNAAAPYTCRRDCVEAWIGGGGSHGARGGRDRSNATVALQR